MSNAPPEPERTNPLGSLSLGLGVASVALVFGIGLCAVTGVTQGWIRLAGTPLYVCGASSAFVGLISAGLGIGGMFGRNRPKAAAIAGLVLGLAGICLFLTFIAAVRNGLGG